jgi:hypothetical protein
VQVYWKRAEQLEREKDYRGAISDFQQVNSKTCTVLPRKCFVKSALFYCVSESEVGFPAAAEHSICLGCCVQVVQAAQTLSDSRSEGQACYRLGLVFSTISDPTSAVTHLRKYRDICQADGDRVSPRISKRSHGAVSVCICETVIRLR